MDGKEQSDLSDINGGFATQGQLFRKVCIFSVKNWGGTVKDAGELKNIKFKAGIEGSAKGPRKNNVKGRDKELE